ncbi:MAG: DUF1244 domain-containing protein [Neorhizobium sp.]|nr:DUF1244 domain-containing protein [Neorhizobium sp.]
MTDASPQPTPDLASKPETDLTKEQQTEFEAAAFRRLVSHLRERSDVQNIDMMNLAGFCRNCLSNWYRDAAEGAGVPLSKEVSREIVYGMPYDEWRNLHQKDASDAQKAAFETNKPKHG